MKRLLIIVTLLAFVIPCALGFAEPTKPQDPGIKKGIDLALALELINAAKKKAEEIRVPMVIAVVDAGGNLVATQRMNGALLVSIGLAANKAYTAVALKMPTQQLADLAQPGKPLFGIHNADGGRIVIFGGGVPLKRDNEIIGAIGVSGGSVEEDILCAMAGVERLKSFPSQ
jgi:uncharacterized protein GlcG (DUF336 family)